MNDKIMEARTQVEEEQAKFAALLEAHPEAQAIAMAYIAGMESALAKVEARK